MLCQIEKEDGKMIEIYVKCKRCGIMNGWGIYEKYKGRRCVCGWFLKVKVEEVCEKCGLVMEDGKCECGWMYRWEKQDYVNEWRRRMRDVGKMKDWVILGVIGFGLCWGFGGWAIWEIIKDWW